MKDLSRTQKEKYKEFEAKLASEGKDLRRRFKTEEKELREKHQREFEYILDNATRRAIGKVKKCNCSEPYLCRHNKTASYNTRRPIKIVLQFLENAKRLRKGGKIEEAIAWEEKARAIDEKQQEIWRQRVSSAIVSSTWGGEG